MQSRRRFLKISTGAAGLAATGVPKLSLADLVQQTDPTEVRTVPTYCDICFWKCGAIAYTRGGRLWKIEGNPEDPLSEGRLCPRGTGGVGAHYDPNRLTTPLIRRQTRGDEEWVQVTWGEALDHIAEKMQAIKTEHGPEAMAMFSHGVGAGFFRHMLRAYGATNFAGASYAQCRGPRDAGFELTFGDGVGSPERTDIRNTRCLVLVGSHLGENMHNTQVQEFADAVGAGASIIVVDPRYSVAASKAKHYLPVKPGTDIALLLAWMNVLVTEGLYDREYVESHGFGFDAFETIVAQYTPEWAYPRCGIEPGVIRETAREMARHSPATIVHPGRHATWYGDDTQRSRALALLNALLGSWGRKGGFYTPSRLGVPAYQYPPYPTAERGPADNPNGLYPFAASTLSTGVRDATLTGEPYPIKGWLIYASNLMQALPNQQETIRAIQNLDLLVVIDVVPNDMAGWADVVLPESVFLERYDDVFAGSFRDPFISLRQPVVEAPADQKPGWWIARELATRLGLAEYFPWQDIEEYLDHRLQAAGLSLEVMKEKGVVKGARQPLFFDEGAPAEFATPSGKIEFYSTQLSDAGFDPVPVYTPPEEPPPGSFRLLFGRSPVHTFTRTVTNPVLHDMKGENEVWLNADIARRYGLDTGDWIRLRNQDGVLSNRVKVFATRRIRQDCVFMIHGFGQTAKGMLPAHRRGASDTRLITRYVTDPLMGGTGMSVNFVTIEPEV